MKSLLLLVIIFAIYGLISLLALFLFPNYLYLLDKYSSLFSLIIILIPMFIFFQKKEILEMILLPSELSVKNISIVFIIALGVGIISFLLNLSFWQEYDNVIFSETDFDSRLSLMHVLTAYFLAPLIEEFVFRGVVFKGLLNKYSSPVFAILLSSMLFSLVHINLAVLLSTFILGILLGVIYYYSNSLHLTILSHLLININIDIQYYLFPVTKTFISGSLYYGVCAICVVFIGLLTVKLKK